MRIVVLIESLTFGGAERQACVLAGEFKRRGHQVCVATYHQDDFYRPLLEREQVEHRFLGGQGKISWALNVRRFLRTHGQDVVLAFLPGPSAYAELAGLPRRSWGLVVSERSAGIVSKLSVKTHLHMLADFVTVNSHSARTAIEKRLPLLRPRLITIYNVVRVENTEPERRVPVESTGIRLVVPASLDRNKNAQGLLSALATLRAAKPPLSVCVDWYGSQKVEPELLPEIRKTVTDQGLDSVFHLHPATDRIHDLMSQADAVMLPSFNEGLPNAVCEGMMLGKPILMSNVCDARYLVREGGNGFLFNPCSPDSIADAIRRLVQLTPEERSRMGTASRRMAETLFDIETIVDRYLRVLQAAAENRRIPLEHWPGAVPDTALQATGLTRSEARNKDRLGCS